MHVSLLDFDRYAVDTAFAWIRNVFVLFPVCKNIHKHAFEWLQ